MMSKPVLVLFVSRLLAQSAKAELGVQIFRLAELDEFHGDLRHFRDKLVVGIAKPVVEVLVVRDVVHMDRIPHFDVWIEPDSSSLLGSLLPASRVPTLRVAVVVAILLLRCL